MKKTYLFSPVGYTDPIKYFRDGSLLHICRVYRPDVVYLYLSSEMMENHRKDDRYVKTLRLLGDKLGHTFDIRLIEREDLVDVHHYDVFYWEFREYISRIMNEMGPEDQLLLNMASGTPAMKSALLILSTLAEYSFQPIQVASPKKAGNIELEERKEYDVIENWELDEDNEEDFQDRSYPVRCMNLMKLLKIDMIKKHLKAYDYYAAENVARELKNDISPKALQLIEAAGNRLLLNWNGYRGNIAGYEDVFRPVKAGDKQKYFEYALTLDIKLRKGEYVDFIRGLTPLVVDLGEIILKQLCGVNVSDYCRQIRKGLEWDREKLAGTELLSILNKTFSPFRYGNIYSIHLNALIQEKCPDRAVADRMDTLIHVEQSVRNLAAHEIVSVTREWVQQRSGKTPAEIMELIRFLFKRLQLNKNEENWNSYDAMNDCIIELLEEGE